MILSVQILLLDQSSDCGRHGFAEISGLTQLSLTLSGLETELVTTVGVGKLNLSALGCSESLGGSLVSFDCHGGNPFRFYFIFC